jgi:glutamine cyclotransferase
MIRAMGRQRQNPRRGRHFTTLVVMVLSLCPLSLIGADAAPILRYGFQVEERLPMDRANFTQGLQIVGDRLYVGTGLYGQSRLREYSFPDLTLEREHALPETLFGEGVTRLGDRIYQLTWHAGQILVYEALNLEPILTAEIQTEGWGLTHDGESLIYSDGTPILRFLDPDGLEVTRELPVTIAGRPLPRLNELEYIDGEIWANVWMANQLVRINPADGRVTGIVDLRGLLPEADRAEDTDVLNGIAWDSEQKALWVTGKRWPWLYRVRIHALPGP